MIRRLVVARESVVVAADVFRNSVEHFRFHILRGFEHQMLEQMREAVAVFRVVLRADAIPNVNRDARAGIVAHADDAQAVRQSPLLYIKRRNFYLSRRRESKRQNKQQDRNFSHKIFPFINFNSLIRFATRTSFRCKIKSHRTQRTQRNYLKFLCVLCVLCG